VNASADLDHLDRATLRAWRVANLAGWWLAGAVTYSGIGTVLSLTFVQKIAYEAVGWQAMAAGPFAALFAAATAGWLVGAKVHRAAGVVGALTVLVPGGLLPLFALAAGPVELGYALLLVGLPAGVAGGTARAVWRRRPRALRSPG
jgi:hypothetical protein